MMRNNKNNKHRLNVNLTDGEYYTLRNLANFYGMSVSDYVKKSCNILGIYPQAEFIPVWNPDEKDVDLIDNTPDAVQNGYMTLQEYYELEEENR